MERIYLPTLETEEDITIIQDALDENYIEYDWDSGERLMVCMDDLESVCEILSDLGYPYNVI